MRIAQEHNNNTHTIIPLTKRSMVGKNSLKMKPQWARKPFQVAAGHSINITGFKL